MNERNVIGHVTIGLGICSFLLVVNNNHASILRGYGNMGPQIYRGHELDLLGSRDVIGHVITGLTIYDFLYNKKSIEVVFLSRIVAEILHVKHLARLNYY